MAGQIMYLSICQASIASGVSELVSAEQNVAAGLRFMKFEVTPFHFNLCEKIRVREQLMVKSINVVEIFRTNLNTLMHRHFTVLFIN